MGTTQTRYKLTTQARTTYGGFQWIPLRWEKTSGNGRLCSNGWLYCYCDPLLAVLHSPIHASIYNPILWEVQVRGESKTDGQMKEGWTEMRLVRRLEPPAVTLEQRVRYAILCALEVYHDADFDKWAARWLNGTDRSENAATRAEMTATAERAAVAWATEAWAEAAAAEATYAAVAWVAEEAARAMRVAWAVEAAARAADIDLCAIAKKAMKGLDVRDA